MCVTHFDLWCGPQANLGRGGSALFNLALSEPCCKHIQVYRRHVFPLITLVSESEATSLVEQTQLKLRMLSNLMSTVRISLSV